MESDYERIARVIRYLDKAGQEQPPLEQIAQVAGCSPAHFHRMFHRWAGITPKDFIKSLTFSRARDLLRSGQTVLDTTYESGLSSPGRLHDLCITLSAATPGDIKNRGRDLKIEYSFVETPFGEALIANCQHGICHLVFVVTTRQASFRELQIAWPESDINMNSSSLAQIAQQIFIPRNITRQIPVDSKAPRKNQIQLFVKGTQFQLKVWRALMAIPDGSVTSYGKIASLIEQPKASRAVGSAVGANPIAHLIPCHRVIRETGAIGQYRWGVERKKCLLLHEFTRKGGAQLPNTKQ